MSFQLLVMFSIENISMNKPCMFSYFHHAPRHGQHSSISTVRAFCHVIARKKPCGCRHAMLAWCAAFRATGLGKFPLPCFVGMNSHNFFGEASRRGRFTSARSCKSGRGRIFLHMVTRLASNMLAHEDRLSCCCGGRHPCLRMTCFFHCGSLHSWH